ncbi:hypothetical protein [Pseudomonas saudiphocaensis]|uniref:hypothetical protein n=1 Tax=Pseudomonas saudiphocaensis TaxID=1499686 RepID=UPI000AD9BC04|nr:hypothetical protein [Pseudomonas saudiphocaensis]
MITSFSGAVALGFTTTAPFGSTLLAFLQQIPAAAKWLLPDDCSVHQQTAAAA